MSSVSIVNDNINSYDLNASINSSVSMLNRLDPVTKTVSFAVSDAFDTYVYNGANAITVTLPSAPLNYGRVLHFRNVAFTTNALSSSISDVLAIGTTTPLVSSILASGGNIGKSATLVSNGVNWVVLRTIIPA